MNVLADHPAVLIMGLEPGHDIQLEVDKGYARKSSWAFYLKGFPGDKYEWIRSFSIGCDGDDPSNVWAFGNGAMLTSSPRSKELALGFELGDVIRVEGVDYRVEAAPNHNISLVAV